MQQPEQGTLSLNTPPSDSLASASPQPWVAILLCTKDGEDFLSEQLDSIARQTHCNWRLIASDDGSTDRTLSILDGFRQRHPDRVDIRPCSQRGFCANFLSLATDPSIEADYYAYCDQDDIWEPGKLSLALYRLRTLGEDVPALYCSRTRLIDRNGAEIGLTRKLGRPPGFRNALVENICSGNAMVFNQAARHLLVRAGMVDVFFHDWWTYLLVTACGGVVHYEQMSDVLYRQHSNNIIGPNIGMRGMAVRVAILLDGRFGQWIDANVRALEPIADMLESGNLVAFTQFCKARRSGLIARLFLLKRSGVYGQTPVVNMALALAVLLGRV